MFTGFKQFLETSLEQEVKDTLHKLPKSHQNLIKGYHFKFESGTTLKGSEENVGMVHINNDKKKEIHVASPWRYPREFVVLHEVGHLIYEKYIKDNVKLKKKWKEIVKNTKNKVNQSEEELFCHAYAAFYCKHPPVIHHHQEWRQFIKDLP